MIIFKLQFCLIITVGLILKFITNEFTVCSKIITNKMTLMDYPLFQG